MVLQSISISFHSNLKVFRNINLVLWTLLIMSFLGGLMMGNFEVEFLVKSHLEWINYGRSSHKNDENLLVRVEKLIKICAVNMIYSNLSNFRWLSMVNCLFFEAIAVRMVSNNANTADSDITWSFWWYNQKMLWMNYLLIICVIH